ncbi:hypothetical protein V8C44DRAFT_365716 [Trichoderma aethiopicum]
MGDIFSLELPHVDQVEIWAQWTPQEQREVLEVLRTGEKRSIVHRLLLGRDGRDLFHVSEVRWGDCQPSTIQDARDNVYPTFVKIGEQYGLTKEEFDHFLTIPSPRLGERAFYPFHVLSRWANAAGHEEPHTEEAMTYFFAAYHCKRLARVKREKPTATREEILWYNLDWGLPTVPWARHPFKMSLVKGPDHGIAMMLELLGKSSDAWAYDFHRHSEHSKSSPSTNSTLSSISTLDSRQ